MFLTRSNSVQKPFKRTYNFNFLFVTKLKGEREESVFVYLRTYN